jgi:hypothetical protein
MKKLFRWAIALLIPFCVAGGIYASRVVYNQLLVSETALAYDNTYTVDLGSSVLPNSNVDTISMQAAYSSATISTVSLTDGKASTGTITVANNALLLGVAASNTLTVSSNTFLSGKSVYFDLNGTRFLNGDLWNVGASSAATAISIKNAINTYGGTSALFSASTATADGVVTITCVVVGAAGNNYTLSSSTAAALVRGAAKFSGGRNHPVLIVAGYPLTEGTEWTHGATAALTAKSISDAIQAHATLGGLIGSTWTAAGVVTATSTTVGAGKNYSLWSSTLTSLTTFAPQMKGGVDSAIVTASSKISSVSHGLTTGLPVLYTLSAGTSPGTLVANTTYYVIRVDANSFKLASSQAHAIAGTAVAIATQTARGGGIFSLAPLPIAGTPSFKWQSSNDGTNWSDLAVSSVTMSSLAPASTLWDFSEVTINFRYLRLNVVAPTAGGINLVVTGVGRSN